MLHYTSKTCCFILLVLLAVTACQEKSKPQGPYFGNGVHNGWVDQHTITIWTRLTRTPEMKRDGQPFMPITREEEKAYEKLTDKEELHRKQIPEGLTLADMEGACLGAAGQVQLVYYPTDQPESRVVLDWESVNTTKNYTRQWKLKKLKPGTKYRMELYARSGQKQVVSDTLIGSFKTAPAPATPRQVAFSVVSCHDYIRRDSTIGHKIYPAMAADSLDFFVHTGDIEYYDKANPFAMTEEMMRFKWDRLFALPLQRNFYSTTSGYFMKDDHDALKNDAYKGQTYGTVTFERGLEIFDKEQFPTNDKPYKTIRWGKDLQVWILEGRNYRSKNTDPDGPQKTILGSEQKNWLYKTLAASDATYKVIISSSPILGPDRPKGKNDNYSNEAFAYEGNEIREFINRYENVFVCTGDRHWQYVTHFEGSNLWEFSSGAGADAHAGGWDPDNVKPEHRFLRVKGGYLYAKVYYEEGKAHLRFEHRDVNGQVVHEEIFPKEI